MDEAHKEMQSSSSRQRKENEGANKQARRPCVHPVGLLVLAIIIEGGVRSEVKQPTIGPIAHSYSSIVIVIGERQPSKRMLSWSADLPWFGRESTSQGRPARPLHHGNTLTLTFSLS